MKSRQSLSTIKIALIALLLAGGSGVACLPGGGGGGSGGQSPFPGGGEEEPGNTRITLTPPPSLNLDGQDVEAGEFVVESATAHTFAGQDSISERVVTSPVIISAVIGTGEHDLFEVPGTTGAIDVEGYFQATTPPLPEANFTITVFGDFSEPLELTVFLPENTDEEFVQITGATEDESENVDIFTDEPLDPDNYSEVAESSSSSGQIDPATPALDDLPESTTPRRHHGSVGARPFVRPRTPGPGSSQIEADCETVKATAESCPNIEPAVADCAAWAAEFEAWAATLSNPEQCVSAFESFSGCQARLGCDGLQAAFTGENDPCASVEESSLQACE